MCLSNNLHLLLLLSLTFIPFQVQGQVAVGDSAPDFTLQDKDGNSYTLSDYEGKVVLLEFIGHT